MAEYIKREQILGALMEKAAAGIPIIGFGAGSGLTGACAETEGVDYICVYSTAICRMQGVSSTLAWLPYSNCNEEVFRISSEILPLVHHTPCVAGVGAHDPRVDMDSTIDKLISMGYSGINNEPFVNQYTGAFRELLEEENLGFSREVELIRKAHAKDIFTLAWISSEDEAAEMIRAGADVLGIMIGYKNDNETDEEYLIRSTDEVNSIVSCVRKMDPAKIMLIHGGPYYSPEAVQYTFERSDVNGYATGSTGEKYPVKQGIHEALAAYKTLKLRGKSE